MREPHADLAIVEANVITMEGARPRATALAARDGRLVAVGDVDDVRPWIGPRTTVLRLPGRTVLPGFIETHTHLGLLGVRKQFVDCRTPPNQTIADIVARVAERARTTPPGAWIEGEGYDDTLLADQRHPNRHDLDAVAPDHPVLLWHVSHHVCAVNSRALALAHITRETPDGYRGLEGHIVRDADGEPTGVLMERGARLRVNEVQPPLSVGQIVAGLRDVHDDYLAVGITSTHDAGVGGRVGPTEVEAYQEATVAPSFQLRVRGLLRVELVQDYLEGRAETDWAFVDDYQTRRFGTRSIKITQDGSIQALTGALHDPYHCDPTRTGMLTMEQERLDALVLAAHRAGFQVAIHTNGDRSIDSALDAFERAQAASPRPDARHRLEHCQMATEAQLDRIAGLGVYPSFFVKHVYYWGDRHRRLFLGPERAPRISPLRSAQQRGIRFALHSDCPVTPLDPLFGVWAAVNRVTREGDLLGPEQRIGVEQALRAYTADAAYLAFEEQEKGTLAPGKLADLTVLGADPTDVDPLEIKDVPVEMTVIGGAVAWARPGAGTGV